MIHYAQHYVGLIGGRGVYLGIHTATVAMKIITQLIILTLLLLLVSADQYCDVYITSSRYITHTPGLESNTWKCKYKYYEKFEVHNTNNYL